MYYCMSGDRDGSGSPWEMWRKREREGRRKRWMGQKEKMRWERKDEGGE